MTKFEVKTKFDVTEYRLVEGNVLVCNHPISYSARHMPKKMSTDT